MNFSIRFLLLAFVGFLLVACSGNKKAAPVDDTYVDPRESQTMQRTNTDTLSVLYNVRKYLDFLKTNQVDSAMAMLYEWDGKSIVPISDSRKKEVLQTIKNFPVLDYQIESLHMYSESDTEVRYSIKFYEKEEGDPRQNTIQCVINPRRDGYYWYLTVKPISVESNYQDD